jgi:hypothetical protein
MCQPHMDILQHHLTESLNVLVMDQRLLKLNVHFHIGTKCYLMLPKKILGFVSVLVRTVFCI